MNTICVVVSLEIVKLRGKIDRVPEERAIKTLAPNRTCQSFHERVRHWGVWNGLDLLDLEDAQVREPAVKAKQRVMISAEVFRWWLAGNGTIEHPAYGDAVDVCALDAEADEASCKHVHDQHYPVTAQENRFAAEEIDA